MVSSFLEICLSCFNRKSFCSISPPPHPGNSTAPTNASTTNNTCNQTAIKSTTTSPCNQTPIQITTSITPNKTPYQTPNQTPVRSKNAIAKNSTPFHGSAAGPSASVHGFDHSMEASLGTIRRRKLSAPNLSMRTPDKVSKFHTSRKEKGKESEQDENLQRSIFNDL